MADVFCAMASAAAHEELAGTATAQTEVWMALEYRRPWSPKPLPGSTLPEAVRARLEAWLAGEPRARFQTIRRPRPQAAGRFHLFLGVSRERAPFVLELSLERYEDLLSIDLDAAVREGRAPGATLRTRPLHLVCTHGQRDRCCAKWGMGVYEAMAGQAPDDVWQTTHVGGHRFAANCVSLPHGIGYGRLRPEDAAPLLSAHLAGAALDLDHVRGRTCWDGPTQAAEIFLRRATGVRALDAYTRATGESHEDRFTITLAEAAGGRLHRVVLRSEAAGTSRPKSCGDALTPVQRFVLESVD